MDFLHAQLNVVQRQLAFVSVDQLEWKTYVQAFTWSVCLFESYLLCVFFLLRRTSAEDIYRLRQYPLYSKTEPPLALAEHFTSEVFAKSQVYGRDKAKFSLVAGLYKQVVDSAMLHFGAYAWAWRVGGQLLAKMGYGAEYEVNCMALGDGRWSRSTYLFAIHADPPIYCVRVRPLLRVVSTDAASICLPNLRAGREARL